MAVRRARTHAPGAVALSLLAALLIPSHLGTQLQCFSGVGTTSVGDGPARRVARRRRSRIALREEVGRRREHSPLLSLQGDAKLQLLYSVLNHGVASQHVRKLVAQLQAMDHQEDITRQHLLSGTWRPLASDVPESLTHVSLYSGGQFHYEGSTLGGGLFKALLKAQAPGATLGGLRVRIAGREVVASAEASLASGRSVAISYSARLGAVSSLQFTQRVVALDAPAPIGTRTPIMERDDSMTLAYVDGEVMVWRDDTGHFEVFQRVHGEDGA